jgi:uncharacterized protein YrrD
MTEIPDLGPPASYLTLEEGTPVYSSDGERIGRVEEVVADLQLDVFEGIVVDTSPLPGGHRYADATQIDEIHEGGVLLKLDRHAAEQLPKQPPTAAG